MPLRRWRAVLSLWLLFDAGLAVAQASASGSATCSAFRRERVPQSFDGCGELPQPSAFMEGKNFALAAYEKRVSEYLDSYCYRDEAAGWRRDKRLRDVGPYVAILDDGVWTEPTYYGTHHPVVVWYNRPMLEWLRANRPARGEGPAEPPPVPDGAIMIKEMYPPPAARCDSHAPEHLKPAGIAFMVRDSRNARDGWFWGSWSDSFVPDWPAPQDSPLPGMGFGQYCLNCHASARDNQTFADLENVQGEPGEVNVYLSQNFLFQDELAGPIATGHHEAVGDTSDDPPRHSRPRPDPDPALRRWLRIANGDAVAALPSQTYDNVWVPGGGPGVASEFVTSDQCIGCHDAGSTGLQFDMTAPDRRAGKLLNLSPYGTWRTSPMGLGGRDPVFYAQLASEVQTFHPDVAEPVQDVCLGCHGILGQRQYAIDRFEADGTCGTFLREYVDAIPYPTDVAHNPLLARAPYGALARDGISCAACHHMVLTEDEIAKVSGQPQNHCVEERQQRLNPRNEGFARTFTGSFYVGPPDRLYGPFEEPKTLPMEHALGIQPAHDPAVRSSEMCGTCHTVHLPIYRDGEVLGYTYEQTTYPEWAFSAYRSGTLPGGGALPLGAGTLAESCQSCHMPSSDPSTGELYRSKIASIQELRSFPATDNTLGHDQIDLEAREGFARHTLVGLNLFFVEMAKQFPDVLGIRTQDPMMVSNGLDPVLLTERALMEQASTATATIGLSGVRIAGSTLSATVTVTSRVGHKFPSGVGFRRAFVELAVLDGERNVLWASGRTDGAGVIVDGDGEPVGGELWWESDCSARLPGVPHQPHYTTITAEDQAQIYQELVTSPAPVPEPRCGEEAVAGGRLTTSFLSICGHVKDNRILPHGFLPLADRVRIAEALGAGEDLARDAGPVAVGDDPDYQRGGGDSLDFAVELTGLAARPAAVRATLYYQAIPPFYLQDRFCTAEGADTRRLAYLVGHLELENTPAEGWKLAVSRATAAVE